MSIKVKPRKSNRGVKLKVQHKKAVSNGDDYEMREMFIGYHTIFSLIGFTVGGILVGRSLWQYSQEVLGLPLIILLGLLIFMVSGYISGQFHDRD